MKKHVGFLTVSFLLMSSLSSAQDNCPEEFRYAGTLSGTSSSRYSLIKRLFLNSLRMQRSMTPISKPKSGRRTKTQSPIEYLPQDIPKGIHITPYGSSDLDKVWAVSEPKLMEIKAGNGTSTRYAFGMRLFCS